MGQQLKSWRSANGQNAWLSMLVDAMEKVAPASSYAQYGSHFSLQN